MSLWHKADDPSLAGNKPLEHHGQSVWKNRIRLFAEGKDLKDQANHGYN